LRATTGLPVSTMSQAVVEGLRGFDARRIAVATAYADEVNARLKAFLRAHGFDVLALKGFGLLGFNQPDTMREADIIALGSEVCAEARAAEGLLISCGGLRTLGVAKPLEARHGIPVVASTQAAFWSARRRERPCRWSRAAARANAGRPCALRPFLRKLSGMSRARARCAFVRLVL
jgi:arylmalonate decarboxylase